MLAETLEGGFADTPVDAAHAFRAVLTALSRPGTILTAASAAPPAPLSRAAGTVLLTFADHETPLYLAPGHDTPEIRDWLTFHTGAPVVGPETAVFALGDWASLAPLDRYGIGTPEYPDRSATLIVEVDTLTDTGARLTGPGIETAASLSLPEIEAFRRNRALFPLGLDFIFTCGDRLAGLPRSTIVEAV